jgi:ComF family protein
MKNLFPKAAFGRASAGFLDCLYPPICEICGCGLKEGAALCEPCSTALPRIKVPFCETCGESFQGQIDGSFDCPNCHEVSFHFEFARAAMDRSDAILQLIHRLKYGREIHLAGELGKLACEALGDRRFGAAVEQGWPLVPVPLHRSRQRERQFNQAEEIVRAISHETGHQSLNLLKRIRRTVTQTRLSRKQRMENLKRAFALRTSWRGKSPVTPSEVPGVILVDDVFTTGSTVDACAKILRKAGVKRVVVLTVLRG